MAPPTDSCRNSLHDLRDPRRWRRGHARSRGKRGPRRGRRRNARAPSPCRTGRWPNIPRTKRPPSWGPLDEPHGRRLGHARLLHAFDRELEPAGSRRHDALPVLEDLGGEGDSLKDDEHRLGPEGGLRVVHEPARHVEEVLTRHPPVDVAGPLEVVRAFGHSHRLAMYAPYWIASYSHTSSAARIAARTSFAVCRSSLQKAMLNR